MFPLFIHDLLWRLYCACSHCNPDTAASCETARPWPGLSWPCTALGNSCIDEITITITEMVLFLILLTRVMSFFLFKDVFCVIPASLGRLKGERQETQWESGVLSVKGHNLDSNSWGCEYIPCAFTQWTSRTSWNSSHVFLSPLCPDIAILQEPLTLLSMSIKSQSFRRWIRMSHPREI